MNLQEIRNFLKELFLKPLDDGKKRHIVFWYDENEDFTDEIDSFDLEGIKVIKLTENNAFWIKHYIEKEDETSNILIYSNMKKIDEIVSFLGNINKDIPVFYIPGNNEMSKNRQTIEIILFFKTNLLTI